MLLKFPFSLQKFLSTLPKCLTSLQKFPSEVTKVPYVTEVPYGRYKSAPKCY